MLRREEYVNVVEKRTFIISCDEVRIMYPTKASSMWAFFLSPMYSPILALLSRGFSKRKSAISDSLAGVERICCSIRKAMPCFGFLLNCSVAARISWGGVRGGFGAYKVQ